MNPAWADRLLSAAASVAGLEPGDDDPRIAVLDDSRPPFTRRDPRAGSSPSATRSARVDARATSSSPTVSAHDAHSSAVGSPSSPGPKTVAMSPIVTGDLVALRLIQGDVQRVDLDRDHLAAHAVQQHPGTGSRRPEHRGRDAVRAAGGDRRAPVGDRDHGRAVGHDGTQPEPAPVDVVERRDAVGRDAEPHLIESRLGLADAGRARRQVQERLLDAETRRDRDRGLELGQRRRVVLGRGVGEMRPEPRDAQAARPPRPRVRR